MPCCRRVFNPMLYLTINSECGQKTNKKYFLLTDSYSFLADFFVYFLTKATCKSVYAVFLVKTYFIQIFLQAYA